MKLTSPLRLLAAAFLASASFLAQAADVTVAYQTTVDPAKVAQADGTYEKKPPKPTSTGANSTTAPTSLPPSLPAMCKSATSVPAP